MNYKEFIESLVNAETESERMELVKENMASFEPKENPEDVAKIQALLDTSIADLETANGTISEKDQEIKDRFFGNYDVSGDGNPDEQNDADGEQGDDMDGDKTLSDLGFGEKSFEAKGS